MLTIELKWEPVHDSGLAGYQLGYEAGGATSMITRVPSYVTCITLQIDLNTRVLHEFWVQAYDKAGNKGAKTYIKFAYQA